MQLWEQIRKLINNKFLKCNLESSNLKIKNLCYVPKKTNIVNYNNYKKMNLKLNNQGIILTNEVPIKTKKGRPYFIRNGGELIIGKQNLHNRSFYIIPKIKNIYVTSNALMSLLPKENINLMQIYFLMKTNVWIHYINSLNSGTGQKEYSENQILNFKMPYTKDNDKIVVILEKTDILIKNMLDCLKTLNNQKKYFLSKMFI